METKQVATVKETADVGRYVVGGYFVVESENSACVDMCVGRLI